MPKYITNIKSHTDAPDFETITDAPSFKEATDKVAEKYDLDEDTIIANTVEDEDQPAEYGDDGQGNYN